MRWGSDDRAGVDVEEDARVSMVSGAGQAFVAPGWNGGPKATGQVASPVAPPAGGLTEADVFEGMRKGLMMRAEAAENDALVLELGARAKRSDAAVLRTAAGKVGDLLGDVPAGVLMAGLGVAGVPRGGGGVDSTHAGPESGRDSGPDSGRDSGAAQSAKLGAA